MRIAVVGGGVSGLGAAWALKGLHEVVLFEKDRRAGGHANTLSIDYDGTPIDVDTGFIVYNEPNYPNFTALLDHLGVETAPSDMSFSVSDPAGFEWASTGLGGLFAWKRNLARPAFLLMLNDMLRFNARARADLRANCINGATLDEYVSEVGVSPAFLQNYLLPMGAAIWSMPEADMLRYPAASFLRFFDNHRLLHAIKTKWRTIPGGSRNYVRAIMDDLGPRARLGEGAVSVSRDDHGVNLRTISGATEHFDQIILAGHAGQSLALLSDADNRERGQLGAIRHAPNTAYLHRDPALMPRRKAAWASWNYLRGAGDGRVCVSYWMNRLQNLDAGKPLFVTLNPSRPPAADKTFAMLTYYHPQFDKAALDAQTAIIAGNGARRTWFAGAWLGHGFHEDGLSSGFRIAEALGARLPWHGAPHRAHAPIAVGKPLLVNP